ncbi:hypothetical protein HDU83_008702 [Entophlyctis luteolus]|nr:hypothetical protein HDU83_008702 [Entophlyctis luteolus]
MPPPPKPLAHLRVVEFAGLAPVPFVGMLLADFGARVVRIDRPVARGAFVAADVLGRGKRTLMIDLRDPAGAQAVLRLMEHADVVLDPFRPGVLESLSLGPQQLHAVNSRCVFARLTGFGQTGPMSKTAGHDINYVAISGLLAMLGRSGENPTLPGNLLADFAGGSLMCVIGILIALIDREKSGRGQVVDAAMIDGVAYLSTFLFKMQQLGLWSNPPGENMLDSGAHFYDTYKTKDGKFMAVGAIEPQFYRLLLKGLDLPVSEYANSQLDSSLWPEMKRKFAAIFCTKSQAEWTRIFDNTDACVTPVLDWKEAMDSAHYRARWGDTAAKASPMVSPVLSRTPGTVGEDSVGVRDDRCVLRQFGLSEEEISRTLELEALHADSKMPAKL